MDISNVKDLFLTFFCSIKKKTTHELKLSSLPRVRGSVEDSDSYVLGEMIGFHQRK